MSRNPFGWSLPPGCTQRMIDEAAGVEQPCAVCGMGVEDCCCPECTVCGEQGNPQCYAVDGLPRHGMKLNREQTANRQKAKIRMVEQQLEDEQLALNYIEQGEQTEWQIDETADPWR